MSEKGGELQNKRHTRTYANTQENAGMGRKKLKRVNTDDTAICTKELQPCAKLMSRQKKNNHTAPRMLLSALPRTTAQKRTRQASDPSLQTSSRPEVPLEAFVLDSTARTIAQPLAESRFRLKAESSFERAKSPEKHPRHNFARGSL